ncbi:hypothetical protein GCM10010123_19640 [Pilimelia anulata]|uniref:VWA domain-containing protein n=1 Tax=Pilimelia anulata TaxID=53371 RepID=A0A8J3B273_9ACTN|nr:vWA domain-containing protein [Pilimelia anulata]GGJ89899.1 hypothetical protein GCM10010123_19640 [Pilimelia anulata]
MTAAQPAPAASTIGGHINPTGAPTAPVDPTWQRLSDAWTQQVPILADRTDLTVVVAPGAGHGSPACFFPLLNRIEVNGDHLGADPATVDPWALDAADQYPVGWGLLVHEAAHARHSHWDPPGAMDGVPWPVFDAARHLDESRIEYRQLRRRPIDRLYLRAATRQLLMHAIPPVDDVHVAGRACALLLARADAGVLDRPEVRPVRTAVRKLIGTDRLRRLQVIWRKAHRTRDDDTARMVDLARQWCEVLGIDTTGYGPAMALPSGTGGSLYDAVAAAIGAIAAADAADAQAAADALRRALAAAAARQRAKEAEALAAKRSRNTAHEVFGKPAAPGHTRTPKPGERASARQLARALKAAAQREPVTIHTTSETPPGRLIPRAAVTAAAQRAAGVRPDAQPWRSSHHRRIPNPPLAVGITVDVSLSMRAWLGPLQSVAWITAQATRWAQGRSATVTFGENVTAITRPGQPPGEVRELGLEGNTVGFTKTVDALDGALDLGDPRAGARLLVVVSDGEFTGVDTVTGQLRINRLRAAGCAVLWLGPPRSTPLHGVTTRLGIAPAQAGKEIADAATAALRGHPGP